MRGSPDQYAQRREDGGIIPAHAGLTYGLLCRRQLSWDHPRACGAHALSFAHVEWPRGSSPRMRGSPERERQTLVWAGIIPAHAGLTISVSRRASSTRDHPRACGAHTHPAHLLKRGRGSSPRMRGSRTLEERDDALSGIIPAHAGLTAMISRRESRIWDHPRACGAH